MGDSRFSKRISMRTVTAWSVTSVPANSGMLWVRAFFFDLAFDLTGSWHTAIIEDVDADKGIQFQEDYTHDMTASLDSTHPQNELFDFSIYMDQVRHFNPLSGSYISYGYLGSLDNFFQVASGTIAPVFRETGCPLCCSHWLRRTMYVTCKAYSNSLIPILDEGVIDKKTWLAFLNNLEEKSWK